MKLFSKIKLKSKIIWIILLLVLLIIAVFIKYNFNIHADVMATTKNYVWVADTQGNVVNKIEITNKTVPVMTQLPNGSVHQTGTTNSSVGTIVKSVRVNYPIGVVVDTFGNVWATSETSNAVVEIDSNTANIIKTYAVGRTPTNITADKFGNVWVINSGETTITKLSHSGGVVQTYDVGSKPNDVAIDSVGNAWVTRNTLVARGAITKIDHQTGAQTEPIAQVWRAPTDIVIDKFDNIWVTNPRDDQVYKYNGATGAQMKVINLGQPSDIATDSAGNIWILVDDYTVSKYNNNGDKVFSSSVSMTTIPAAIAVDNSDNVWTTSGVLAQFNGANGAKISEYSAGTYPYGIAFTYETISNTRIIRVIIGWDENGQSKTQEFKSILSSIK